MRRCAGQRRLPQFTVAANTTVYVAEQAASSKVTMVTPHPTAGWLQADASQELAARRTYGYALSYADPRGIIPSQRYLVRPGSLATVTESYFQEVKSSGGRELPRGPPG